MVPAAIAWIAFSSLQYYTASIRIKECGDRLFGNGQIDICLRNAMEQRDAVAMWGLGIPLVLVILASFIQNVRSR